MKLLRTEFVLLAHGGTCGGYGKVVAANGKVVLPPLDGHGPANGSFEAKRLRQALEAFRKLPPEVRKPRPEDVPQEWRKADYPKPPPKGLVLKLHGRAFGLEPDGKVHRYAHDGGSPMLDYFWLTEEEVKALVPQSPKKGDTAELPPWFARRFCLYRMHTEPWAGLGHRRERPPGKTPALALTVEEAAAGQVRLRLTGSVPLRFTGWDNSNRRVAEGDFDCTYEILGYLTYDVAKGAFTRFDVVALGAPKRLGSFKYPQPERGAMTIGVSFELANGSAMESIPPYALNTRGAKEYFSHEE
jgi:hypothetical protein